MPELLTPVTQRQYIGVDPKQDKVKQFGWWYVGVLLPSYGVGILKANAFGLLCLLCSGYKPVTKQCVLLMCYVSCLGAYDKASVFVLLFPIVLLRSQ